LRKIERGNLGSVVLLVSFNETRIELHAFLSPQRIGDAELDLRVGAFQGGSQLGVRLIQLEVIHALNLESTRHPVFRFACGAVVGHRQCKTDARRRNKDVLSAVLFGDLGKEFEPEGRIGRNEATVDGIAG